MRLWVKMRNCQSTHFKISFITVKNHLSKFWLIGIKMISMIQLGHFIKFWPTFKPKLQSKYYSLFCLKNRFDNGLWNEYPVVTFCHNSQIFLSSFYTPLLKAWCIFWSYNMILIASFYFCSITQIHVLPKDP